MEREVTIKIPKTNKVIYGKLRGSVRKPMVVFVHGMTANMDHHLFFNGARFFEKHGFSSFRLNLYDARKGARSLGNTSLKENTEDVCTAVLWLHKQGARKLFLVGHSYGAPAILLTKPKVNGVVLWDPANIKYKPHTNYIYNKRINRYIREDGRTMLLHSRFIAYEKKVDWDTLARIGSPLLIVKAGRAKRMLTGAKAYFESAREPKQFISIPGADHSFHRDGMEEKLFAVTLKWLKKYA